MQRHLERVVRAAVTAAMREGRLREHPLPPLAVEIPGDPKFGDVSTNAALVLARGQGQAPHAIAPVIVGAVKAAAPEGWLAAVDVAGPGFINFRLAPAFWHMIVREVLAAGEAYGRSDAGAGKPVQVEFVSANPTGPLHIGHGRGAVIGDVTARLLEAVGHPVEREYYVNDAGRQMELLGRSTWARYRQLGGDDVPLPEDGYPGEYLVDVAKRLRAEHGDALAALPEGEAVARCRDAAAAVLLDEIRDDLARFGIRFDRFVSERDLHARGVLAEALAALPPELLYRQDGALFYRTTHFGDEKDRAVLRGTGEPTYYGGDVAHYHETVRRGFHRLVNVLGADHHGYVARLRALVAGFGFPPDLLHVLLVQIVNLTRGGEPVRMGKRLGEFVTLREVVDEVGADAARFFFLLRKNDSQLDFDLELAKQRNTDNPVFYVQYAHARIASVFRQAEETGVRLAAEPDVTPLGEPEVEVLRVLGTYPDVLAAAARELEPHRIVFFLLDLAAAFHRYYNKHRVLTDDAGLTQARLALLRAVRDVLRGALGIAGVHAPERM